MSDERKKQLTEWLVRSAWLAVLTLAAALINRYTGVQVEVPPVTVIVEPVPGTPEPPRVHVLKPE